MFGYDPRIPFRIGVSLCAEKKDNRILIDPQCSPCLFVFRDFQECAKCYRAALAGNDGIAGLMLESCLLPGKQNLMPGVAPDPRVSVTDACIGFDETERLILNAAERLRHGTPHSISTSKPRVAYLGPAGTFTHEAARKVFAETAEYRPCSGIQNVFAAVETGECEYGCVPVENTTEGVVIGTLDVLKICSRDPGAPPVEYVKVSGGIFLDMTIHDFDMVRFMSGEEVEEVFAYGAVRVDPAIGEAGDIDTAVISMKLQSGAIAVIDNSREASYGYDQRVEAFGRKGQVAVSNDTESTAVISDADGVHAEKPLYFFLQRYMQAYVDEVSEFIDCIVNDKEVTVGIDCGLQPVLIGLAAKCSLAENRPVKISEIASEYGL